MRALSISPSTIAILAEGSQTRNTCENETFRIGVTGDTIGFMGTVNVRDLRNHGGEVLDRVSAGEEVTVLRSGGTVVARLVPVPRPGLSPHELVRRRRNLAAVDPEVFKRDVDDLLDATL